MATSGQKRGEEKSVLISAASSLTAALEDTIESFNSLYPEITVRVSFGGSGYLATQIENGAPVDILISADQKDVTRLINKKIARIESSKILFRNTLILAGFGNLSQNSLELNLKEILEHSDKIGIGNPNFVAAGSYTKNLLTGKGLFSDYSAKFILGNSVRQVVGWLESGEVEYAFIYKSDARLNPAITTIREFSSFRNPEILYPAILTLRGEANSSAELFQAFLESERAKNIFKYYGFLPYQS